MKKLLFLLAAMLMLGTGATVMAQNSNKVNYQLEEGTAMFPGGIDSLYFYMCRNLSYPAEAREQGIEGKVNVSFVIEKNGEISSIKVLRDIGGGCGKAVVEMIKQMPKWTPGIDMQTKKPVRQKFNLPVNFTLSDLDETDGHTTEEHCLYHMGLIEY